MFGAFLNGFGILIGGLLGLAIRKPMTVRMQNFFKSALGAFTVFYGLGLVYYNVHGGFLGGLRQILIAMFGILLGYWLGKLLRLQKISNRVGHHAATLIAAAQKNPPGAPAAGFVTATTLFCVAPLGILGAAVDGLEGYFYLLLLKAVMDGLATISFVKIFRWPVVLSALPVCFFLNGLTLAAHHLQPWLSVHGFIPYIGIAVGLVTCTVALVILEVRRVELANYLPALAIAPLLAHWLG